MVKTKPAPKNSSRSKLKTDEIVKEIQSLLDSGKPDIDIVRYIATNDLGISVSADPRLMTIKFIVDPAVIMNSGQSEPSGLGKHHLDKAMAIIKTAMNDFTQRNPYHAEYSFAAIYEVPSNPDQVMRWGNTWHYGAEASETLWPWPKIEKALEDWLKKQPVTKKHETDSSATYRLASGQCHVSVMDSRGKVILKGEMATIHAKVKTSGEKVTSVAIR